MLMCIVRLFHLSLLISSVLARKIETSALLPCQEGTEFSARKFKVLFHPQNNTADLDVEIISAINGNFTVDLALYVYGIKAFTTTTSGCDIAKPICPISPGRFDVQTTLKVPQKYVKNIPSVAYTVPDIDAYITAKVYYVDEQGQKKGTKSVACVVAQLSNGKSVLHNYVSWILFGFTLLGSIVSVIAYVGGHYRTSNHIMSNTLSLFTYFQSMAVIAMMAVERLPPIAAAWAQNFVWSLGIINVGFVEKAVSWYVRSTGGKITNIFPAKDKISVAVYKRSLSDSLSSASSSSNPGLTSLSKRLSVSLNSNLTTTNERSDIFSKILVVQGIKRISYLAHIELSNFFITGTSFFIFIAIILIIILGLFKLTVNLLIRAGAFSEDRLEKYNRFFRGYTRGTLFRYFYIGFTQISLLSLWEFTYRESTASVVIAVVIFLVTLASLLVGGVKVILLARKSKLLYNNAASILFGSPDVLYRWGFMYFQYKSGAYWFLIPSVIYNFAKSATIALGQSNGKAQAIVITVIECLYFILLCVLRPYADKKTNGYNIALSVFSIINAVFFLFFSRLFGKHVDVAASIIGVVYFVMNAVVCFVYLVFLIFTCLWAIFNPRPDDRYRPVTDDRNMFMPDDVHAQKQTELDDLGKMASDGYRQSSYFMYDPANGHTGPGAYPTTSRKYDFKTNNFTQNPQIRQNVYDFKANNVLNYNDIQYRSGLYPETRLI